MLICNIVLSASMLSWPPEGEAAASWFHTPSRNKKSRVSSLAAKATLMWQERTTNTSFYTYEDEVYRVDEAFHVVDCLLIKVTGRFPLSN